MNPRWVPPEACPRTLRGRVSLLQARERLAAGTVAPVVRRRSRVWLLWVGLALPVVVVVVWRLLCR